MTKCCFCPGCKTGYNSDIRERKKRGEKTPGLHSAPKDPALFQMWQRVIPRADRLLKPTDFVCAKHFKEEDFVYHQEPIKLFDASVYLHMYEKPRLRKGAIPSVFADVPGHSTYVPKIKSDDKNKKCKKRKRHCASSRTEITETKKRCFSSKEKENVLKTDLSLLPRVIFNCLTPEPHNVLASLNQLAMSIANGNFSTEPSNSSSHCDVENNETEETDEYSEQSKFNHHLQTKVPERLSSFNPKSGLSHNSEIISSQSNIPQPLSSNVLTTESSTSQNKITVKSKHFSQPTTTEVEGTQQHTDTNFAEPQDSITSHADSEIDVDLLLSITKFSFNFLKVNVNAIKKMNSWWTIDCFDNFIACARWNSDCLIERKIVIYEDLKVKVFLNERETIIGKEIEVTSIEAISHLIFKVERLRLCPNILNNEENCFGFLQPNYRCKRRNLCLNCIKWEDGQLKHWVRKNVKVSHDLVELI